MKSLLVPAIVPVLVSLLSLIMLRVAEQLNHDVFSVLIPLFCLGILIFAYFQNSAHHPTSEE
jgi:hypothetical protein